MRRLEVVGLDAFQFERFHRGRLALHFFFQSFDEFALRDDHGIHLLDLMFEMRGVGFKLAQARGNFIVHKKITERAFADFQA